MKSPETTRTSRQYKPNIERQLQALLCVLNLERQVDSTPSESHLTHLTFFVSTEPCHFFCIAAVLRAS